jgi:hypothetical protein
MVWSDALFRHIPKGLKEERSSEILVWDMQVPEMTAVTDNTARLGMHYYSNRFALAASCKGTEGFIRAIFEISLENRLRNEACIFVLSSPHNCREVFHIYHDSFLQ